MTGLFGFPDSREGSRLAAEGASHWGMSFVTSSHSVRDEDDREAVLLDGETSRLGIGWRHGFGDRLELGIEIPYVLHESGSLDSFIGRWHGIFGLPEGIRNERPVDRLLFRYEANGEQLLLDRNASGLGDVRLLGGWQLADSASGSSALRVGLKVPTGGSNDLLGSGGWDLSLAFAADNASLGGIDALSGFYRVSATWLGPHDVASLPDNHRIVGQLSAGLGYDLTPGITLAVQALLRTAVYDSTISPLGDVAAALTMGVRFRLPGNYVLSGSVGEDIHPGSMPDVTFGLSLQRWSR